MKHLLLILLSMTSCAEGVVREPQPCEAELERMAKANAEVRRATEWSTNAHEANPMSRAAEAAHAAVMEALAEQSAAKTHLSTCMAQ